MLMLAAVRLPIVVALATAKLGAERPEQVRSEWTVAFVASIVSLGVEFVLMMNSSWLGFETSAACGCVAPTYWNSI